MKKRLVTTLFSFICAASLALSFTACDSDNNENDDIVTGVEVTEEQWNLAFERAFNVTNITCEVEFVEGEVYSVYNDFFDDGAEFGLFRTMQAHGDNEEAFVYVLQKNRETLPYYISQDFEAYEAHISGTYKTGLDYMLFPFILNPDILNDDIIYIKRFWDYFSEFEFDDGEYRANNLYCVLNDIAYISDIIVKLDSDGYLRYYSVEFEMDENKKFCISCKFDNYGTTIIEVPKEVLDAVEEYKSKNN